VNGGSTLALGVAGSAQPATYNLQSLTVNSLGQVQIVGPVVLTVNVGMNLNGPMGAAANPLWLRLNIASGGLTLNSGGSLNGIVQAPAGAVTINSNALLQGAVTSDRLTINGGGVLKGSGGVMDSINPTRATQGQTLTVTLKGINTHWAAGNTRASFGGEVSVGGGPPGDFGPVQVLDANTAAAQLSVSATAALLPRTVQVSTTVFAPDEVETETLINGFTVVSATPPGSSSSTVTTLAGLAGAPGFVDGAANTARFRDLSAVAVGMDDTLYVADAGNHSIRRVSVAGTVTTLAGNGTAGFADGAGSAARFNNPQGVAVDATGMVYVADTDNHCIRRVAADGTVTTLAGNGTAGFQNGQGTQARFNSPRGVAVDTFGNLYVADSGNQAVRVVSTNGSVNTVAGDGTIGSTDAPTARFNGLVGIAVDGVSLYVYVADTANHRIRRLNASGATLTVAGAERGFADGSAAQARFADPSGLTVDAAGKLLIADSTNSLIRMIDPGLATGGGSSAVTTIAGAGERGSNDGTGDAARFVTPRGVAVRSSSAIVVADTGNHVLRKIVLPPVIAAISPAQGAAGDAITIDGERFNGQSTSGNTVKFTKAGGGQTLAQVTAASATRLTVLVPTDAASGTISVQTEGGTAISPVPFTYIPRPIITGFSPSRGAVASVVTISGAALKPTASNPTVTFAGPNETRLQASLQSATDTEIKAIVPAGAASGRIRVQTEGGAADSATSFTVIVASPVITGFTPSSGQVGSTVTLNGTNLRAETGATVVTFAGSGTSRLQALLTSVTPTSVQAVVPNGAMTGTITLTNAQGSATSATPFTVDPGQNDYQLIAAPASATAVQGSAATFVIYLTSPKTTFSQLVSLSTSGLPAGVTASLTPQQVTAGARATLQLNISSLLAAGSYSFTVRGSGLVNGAELVRTASLTLNVIAGGQTTLSGRVLSTEDEPILGATVSLDGQTATTDAAGAFLLGGVPAGNRRPLMVDGRTASAPNRTYPVIIEPADLVAGQANLNPYTFYLPAIDTQYEVDVVPNQDTVVTTPRVPGVQMTVPAGANLRNRDGSPVARVSITPVPIDRTPAPLPANVRTTLVFTSQPGGAIADVAMPVVYPNLAEADPGTRVELYAFDHDTVQWYVYGYGRVSDDGRSIVPEVDPATGRQYGLRDFSWHMANAAPSGNPGDSGDCPKNRTSNPVDLSTGLKIESRVDIMFGGTRGEIILGRTYTSDRGTNLDRGRFGYGTRDNFDIRLRGGFAPGGAGRIVWPEQTSGWQFNYTRTASDGALIFTNNTIVGQVGDEIRKLVDGTFEYRFKDASRLRFDTSRRLTAIVDRNQNTTSLSYDGAGRLVQVTDAVGRSLTVEYNAAGDISRVTDPLRRQWQYDYQGLFDSGYLTKVTDPLGHAISYGYAQGRLATVTDKRGNLVKQIQYDNSGRVIRQDFAEGGYETYAYTTSGGVVTAVVITDSLGRQMKKRLNASGYVIEQTDSLGQTAIITRDFSTGLPLTITGPCGCAEVTRDFDAQGNVTTITDRLGHTTHYEYEPAYNKVAQITDPLGHATTFGYDTHGNLTTITDALNRTLTMTYDGFGELISISGPSGHASQFEYDASGNVKATRDALGNRATMEYDEIGRRIAMNDPLGRRTTIQYDALDRVISATGTAGTTTLLVYDANGNATSLTNALGKQWRSAYDAKNRVTSTTDPAGRTTQYGYDQGNELVRVTSPQGRVLQYAYDKRGQLKTITDPLGNQLQFTHDHSGNLTSVVDQRGYTTTFGYDELYRRTSTRNPLGQSSHVTYDAVGNVTESVDRLGRRMTFSYDELYRITRAIYTDATVSYGYDSASRLTHIDDTQSGSIDWTYDDANRLLSETTAAGTVGYAYNAAGQIVSMTAADRAVVVYGYDAAGRVHTITQGAETFTYNYDGLSRLASLQRPSGITTAYSYDDVSRLSRLSHADAQGQAIEDYRYSYSLDNQIEAINSLARGTRLPAATSAGEADGANRIPQFGAASSTFDVEGRTTASSDAQGATSYSWDARSRLTQIGLANGQTVSYGYDAAGRLASRTAGGRTTRYLYDGLSIVLDLADHGNVDYLNGLGIDDKLRQTSGADTHYFLHDHLGSTLALTDASGAVVEHQQYEPYGATSGSSLTRYGFTGRELDSATGLMYYRARWYDPRQGRFISEDPVGLAGGSNQYVYAANDPVNLTDPNGLRPCPGGNPLVNFLGGLLDFISGVGPAGARDLVDPLQGLGHPLSPILGGEPPHHASPILEQVTGRPIDYESGAYHNGVATGEFLLLDAALGPAAEAVGEAVSELPSLARGAGAAEDIGGEGVALEFRSIGKEVAPSVEEDGSLVIGKLDDLRKPGSLQPGEYTLEWEKLPTTKLNAERNLRLLRQAMRKSRPIRDVSVDPVSGEINKNTGFLRVERDLLGNRGWTYDPATRSWYPPR
jgi:RHS repeat-associated protein